MMKRKLYLLVIIGLFTASACTDVTMVQPTPGGPTIDFVDIQPKTIREFQDSITITISYKDPDGDLGHVDPDINLITVHDLRLAKKDEYHVPLLAPTGSSISIEGQLEIKLKNTFLLGSGASEQTSYEVVMKDRAGNISNPILTDNVTITRE